MLRLSGHLDCSFGVLFSWCLFCISIFAESVSALYVARAREKRVKERGVRDACVDNKIGKQVPGSHIKSSKFRNMLVQYCGKDADRAPYARIISIDIRKSSIKPPGE